MYVFGVVLPQNDAEAAKWYRQAADQVYAIAQNNLGAMYAKGEGVPQSYVEAYAWFSIAAANGDETAKSNLPKVKARLTPEQLVAAQKRVTQLSEQSNANKE